MNRRTPLTRISLLLLSLAVAACGTSTTLDPVPCEDDSECKSGERCVIGRCLDPATEDVTLDLTDTTEPVSPRTCGEATCLADEQCCGLGNCVDLRQSSSHCGACNNACGPDEVCQDGACLCGGAVCGLGSACCGGGCVQVLSDRENCGACGNACGGGESCVGGACVCVDSTGSTETCGADEVCCPGIGCRNLERDVENCGACGAACGTGERCDGGACQCGTASGQPGGGALCGAGQACCGPDASAQCLDETNPQCRCGDSFCVQGQACCAGADGEVCANLSSDDEHCGSCGNPCPNGQSCISGRCSVTCQEGLTLCGEVCRDLDSSSENCGACDNPCPPGEVCNNGSCGVTCQSGLFNCSGICTDVDRDRENCGACGFACASGEVCSNGTCVTNCPAGQTNCSGECVDVLSDEAHCGVCFNACAQGELCVGGACDVSCPPQQQPCDGQCRDLTSDENHCGACLVECGPREVCNAGTCECPAPFTECSGECVDTSTNPMYCGSCTTACRATDVCSNGSCLPVCDNSAVRLAELFIGVPDYVGLLNPTSCAVDLDGLSLWIESENGADFDFSLPPFMLPAGARAIVAEDNAGDISFNEDLWFNQSSSGAVWLCLGPCNPNDTSNVIDFVHFETDALLPVPPGLQFVGGPLTGIFTSNEDTDAFLRIAFDGAHPTFYASDWTVGPRTLP